LVVCSDDHKPNRPDEAERIQGRGGIVHTALGVPRVFPPCGIMMGNRSVMWGLAVSRAFGDLPLKQPKQFGGPPHVSNLVSAEPEITCFNLRPGKDELLILACDGIWDVMTNEEAGTIAHIHFESRGGKCDSKAEQCARGLVRDSFQRCSDDNLTALVVHLSAIRSEPPKKKTKR